MFNTPILDITIGLVFIFLLYSLLATSVNEMIATALSLRGRMLKKGIIQGMLSDTPGYNRWQSIGMGIWEYICAFIWIFTGRPEKKYKKIGDKFYEHPMIKNYGENRVYSAPSYIKTGNFSTVLLEVLKQEFTDKLDAIAGYRFSRNNNRPSLVEIKQELINQPDIIKIKDLLEYYGSFYANASEPPSSVIDKDTWSILQLHLKNSIYSMEAFTKKVEGWFDDSMNRVSGWYKRQAQVILFLIGLVIAITFNVDVISITKKLSKDDKLREQLLQNAIAYSKQNPEGPAAAVYGDSNKIHDSAYLTEVQKKYRMVDSLLASDIKDVNALMALGWGDYGRSKDSAQVIKKCQAEFALMLTKINADTSRTKELTVN